MKWLAWALGTISAIFLVISFVGATLPQQHVVTREAELPASVEKVWNVLVSYRDYPAWRSDVQSIEKMPESHGQPVWREVGKYGAITIGVVEAKPNNYFVLHTL